MIITHNDTSYMIHKFQACYVFSAKCNLIRIYHLTFNFNLNFESGKLSLHSCPIFDISCVPFVFSYACRSIQNIQKYTFTEIYF